MRAKKSKTKRPPRKPVKKNRYDYDCELDGRFADDYADEIKAMFDAYTASDDTDMAEYFDGSNSAVAKIKSLKGDFESFDGVLFGRVRATLTEPLTEDEEAKKDMQE